MRPISAKKTPWWGSHGSGTIFFTHCNLYCIFCQNYEISHGGEGEEISVEDLAAMMLILQKRGCHNINFVTPSHQVYQILAALPLAIAGGLNVPLVYNTPTRPGLDRPGQFLEVAPGAEAPVPGPADEHQADVGRGQGLLQGPGQ